MVAMAKELAGCRLQTYYPITPASDESEFLEAPRRDTTRRLCDPGEPAASRSRGPEEQGRHHGSPVGGRNRGNHDGDRRRARRRQVLDLHLRPGILPHGRGSRIRRDERGSGGGNAVLQGRPEHRAPDTPRAGRPEVRPPCGARRVPEAGPGKRRPRGVLLRHRQGLQLLREVPDTGHPHGRQGADKLRCHDAQVRRQQGQD